ncbi:MAG: pyridoxamine 5'-phosphate oxidase family protein [Acidobacteriota bacterium]
MAENSELKTLLKKLFSSQLLAVLGTQSPSGPYGNLVAFAETDDLKKLLFATTRSTRKYKNLIENPEVAMVIDNRSNHEDDFHEAVAVTATGFAKELHGTERDELQGVFLQKHKYLVDFVASPTCAFLYLDVKTYYIVQRFQNVTELDISSCPS